MKYFYLLLLLTFSIPAFAQIKKVYLTKNGAATNDSKVADSYILIQKYNDTIYIGRQFDMSNTIMFAGTYRDSSVSIPQGKFIYYQNAHLLNNNAISQTNTNNYLQTIGYFSKGLKTGTWVDYTPEGKKSAVYTYVNGVLNGPYITYFNDIEGQWSVVNVVNGLYEGKYATYNADSLLISEVDYHHNNITNKINHLKQATPPEYFNEYLEKKLVKYGPQISAAPSSILVKLTIDKTGKILNSEIIKGINPEIDSAIVSALSMAPNYNPATYDDNYTEQKLYATLILFHEVESKAFADHLIQTMSKHPAPIDLNVKPRTNN